MENFHPRHQASSCTSACVRLTSYSSILLCCALLLGLSASGRAEGDLRVAPLRIIFSKNIRTQVVMLTNTGKTTATYRLFIFSIII